MRLSPDVVHRRTRFLLADIPYVMETARIAGKRRLERLQMIEHGPEELFGHFRSPGAVGVRESVFGWRRGAPQGRERAGAQMQRVTHVIEAQGVSQLRVQQTDDMAPRTERAGGIFNPRVPRQFGNQMCRNEIAKLTQNGELADRWLVAGFLFHALPSGKAQTRKPTFFTPQPSTLWDSSGLNNT
jgi:hypothetical protein